MAEKYHLVCFSGGGGSALVAIEVARRYGGDRMILLNHDISSKVEEIDIKVFKETVANYVGVSITYANMENFEELDQFDVCVKAKAFKGKNGHPLCTSRQKTMPFMEWLSKAFPLDPVTGRNDHVIIYYGFDGKEGERVSRRRRIMNEKGYETSFPLIEWPRTIQHLNEVGIELNAHYDTFKHNNCLGCLRENHNNSPWMTRLAM